MGQQAGDSLDDVAHVLAAAEVAGQCPPVLQLSQVGDAVLEVDTSRGARLALPLVRLLVPFRGALLEFAVRWCHDVPAGLGAQSLVTGISEDLDRWPVGQELGQPWTAGVCPHSYLAGSGCRRARGL